MMERRLAVTDEGYVGMAPDHARKGDIVCMLYRCSIPVVLRKKYMSREQNNDREGESVTQDETYEFIGECYLHGFVNGEALKDHGYGTPVARKFHLV
jgi:hypothetical protein